MLGLGRKSKAERLRIAAIQADGKRVRAHLAAQAVFATEHVGIPTLRLWDDLYTRAYIYGALDALLSETPPEARSATLTGLVETGFVSFVVNAFGVGDYDARDGLADIVRRQAATPLRHAIADGRTDGLQMRQGLPALLWLAHCVESMHDPRSATLPRT